MEPGLYVTFFNEGEPFDAELPPVGPLQHVVVRDRSLMAERKDGEPDLSGGDGRWAEAERELQRATGKEPGGAKRADLRIGAPEGVYLRFVSFGEAAEHDPVPELGPYAIVVVGRRGVEADGDSLAKRIGTNQNLWELTGVGGSALAGVIRPDIAFRTRSTKYHPDLKPFRSAPNAPRTPSPPEPAPAPARAADRARPPEDPGLTLRDRIGTDPSMPRSSYTLAESADSREWGGAAWRLRYLIIGALIVLIAVFSVPSIRSMLTGGGPTQATVGVGTAITAPEWTYSVGSVRRVTRIGASQPRGTYVVVQVGATNRSRAGAQLAPSNFSLAAASGEQYTPQPTSSAVYFGGANPDSPYIWPAEFPAGRQVVVPLIFDVNPSITGMELLILDVPTTRVRLE
ncbi:MAG: hypothetical protein ACRDG6_05450 [Candidatus Limnocylindria bacterium]